MAVEDDILTRLVAQAVGVVGTSLFMNRLPSDPDTAAAVFVRGGGAPIRTFGGAGSAPVADQFLIQVMVRGADIDAANLLAKNVVAALDWFTGTLNTTAYKLIALAYGPLDLGQDENGRPMKSIAFDVMKERS